MRSGANYMSWRAGGHRRIVPENPVASRTFPLPFPSDVICYRRRSGGWSLRPPVCTTILGTAHEPPRQRPVGGQGNAFHLASIGVGELRDYGRDDVVGRARVTRG